MANPTCSNGKHACSILLAQHQNGGYSSYPSIRYPKGGEKVFVRRILGAVNATIKGAGHFVQEDAGPELAAMINDFIAGEEVRGF